MKTILDKDKMSLAQCRKILNKNGYKYSDEEILKIRNWIYEVSELTLSFLESRTPDQRSQIESELKAKKEKK